MSNKRESLPRSRRHKRRFAYATAYVLSMTERTRSFKQNVLFAFGKVILFLFFFVNFAVDENRKPKERRFSTAAGEKDCSDQRPRNSCQ